MEVVDTFKVQEESKEVGCAFMKGGGCLEAVEVGGELGQRRDRLEELKVEAGYRFLCEINICFVEEKVK